MSAVASKTYLPDETVAEVFGDIVNELSAEGANPSLQVGDRVIPLTAEAAHVLEHVAQAMSAGLAVTVAPKNVTLTTQEAADTLGISRPTLVRMLEAGRIPYTKVNRHRRVLLADVLDFQDRQRRDAQSALAEMVADSQQLGDYDDDPVVARELARRIRRGQ